VRIPNDIPLATYIRQLIKADKVEQFYFTDDWKELRQEVLDDLHYECQECLKKGEYTRAVCVHHVNEVKHRPDLALSKFYIDTEGKQQRQLLPLCNTCHNVIHEKLDKHRKSKSFHNVERW
jgi:5-methylcytosine-specific restriction endonuclease McrA